MTEQPIDKRKESIQALKNANKHLTEIFRQHDNLLMVVEDTTRQLEHLKSKVGDIAVEVWISNGYGLKKLSVVLNEMKNKLEGAK